MSLGSEELQDVTRIFLDGADEMSNGDLMFMDNYDLNDAMSAFEIGEPKLDSGIALPEEVETPPFDPLALMLPEEICWLIDKAFAYEMEWHEGSWLTHTVFVVMHVHHLQALEPDLLPSTFQTKDSSRPRELVTVVLGASVMGLLKCCDLTWRELSKGGMYDAEDWQSDKCDVSLLEGVQIPFVFKKLDEAIACLNNSTESSPLVPEKWSTALRARISLRRLLLRLFSVDIFKTGRSELRSLINSAKDALEIIRTLEVPEPSPYSSARQAIQPTMSRHLSNATPYVAIPVRSSTKTWEAIEGMFEAWLRVKELFFTENLTSWVITANHRQWLGHLSRDSPYQRSLSQSIFYDGVLVLGRYSFSWIYNRFFYEMFGVSYNDILDEAQKYWVGEEDIDMRRIQRAMVDLIPGYIRSLYFNPPRRRRYFMKSILGWQALIEQLEEFMVNVHIPSLSATSPIPVLSHVAILWRLQIIREIVLSGFPLQLYSREEMAYAYWYLCQVIEKALDYLDEVLFRVKIESEAHQELTFQHTFLTAIQSISCSMFILFHPLIRPTVEKQDKEVHRNAFLKRYKWAFRSEYDDFDTPPIGHPEYHRYLNEIRREYPSDAIPGFEFGHRLLSGLVDPSRTESSRGWCGGWFDERLQFVHNMRDTVDTLCHLPHDTRHVDYSRLRWEEETPSRLRIGDGCWFPKYLVHI